MKYQIILKYSSKRRNRSVLWKGLLKEKSDFYYDYLFNQIPWENDEAVSLEN
jgi:hypothetical protein